MMACPNLLLIGAAGRNVGKTEFACELIRRHAAAHPVYGCKITTIQQRDGSCPRGGWGCGVCSSLQDDFCITEERLAGNEKDTMRMLLAGAKRVFWLRVLREHLETGVRRLLECIPAGALVVCESNSARTVLAPGVFLVIREVDSIAVKQSCNAVLAHADRQVTFYGDGWDFQPDRIAVAGRRWVIRPNATAIILAGGGSRRMGQDKSLLDINGQPMISHIAGQLDFFPERLISSNDPEKYAFLSLPVVPDREPGQGPLMGILSGVERAAHDLCFVAGCDIPTLDAGFILRLLAQAGHCDVVIPRHPDGRVEPLLAVYRKSIIPVAEAALQGGHRRVSAILNSLRVQFVSSENMSWYCNLNTMEDYRRWTAPGPHQTKEHQ
jgi:molybdopterin-guanine dinucleotide biosynthesis protein A